MSIISMILVVIVTFFVGLEGILDEFQFHQPPVACTLIGLITGDLEADIILGGSLQMITLGWANVGAAVAPNTTLASVAATIIVVKGEDFATKDIAVATATTTPLAVTGLFLTALVHTASVALIHGTDAVAEEGNIATVEHTHLIALFLRGLRITVPAVLPLAVPTSVVQSVFNAMPDWLSGGVAVDGDMVVAVGCTMVIDMMATSGARPFFTIGFAVVAVSDLTLTALGAIGAALASIYLDLSGKGGNGDGAASGSGGPIDSIPEDY